MFSKLNGLNIYKNIALKDHTHTMLGGPAEYFFEPKDEHELSLILKSANDGDVPVHILGNGSNLIVKDGGIDGIVVSMLGMNDMLRDGSSIHCGPGVLMPNLSKFAIECGLTGLEFACGIPGSVGGGVTMNAGAYGGELKNVLKKVTLMDMCGNSNVLSVEELKLEYRSSIIQEGGLVVVSTEFSLQEGCYLEAASEVGRLTKLRENSQPLDYPSCGSVFKRPEGYYTGKLVSDLGLKGFSIGKAEVSPKHSGFILNKNGSSSKDYIDVIEYVESAVLKECGVQLEREVRIIGRD